MTAKYSFANRIYPVWNELEENSVLAENVYIFCRKIDQLDMRTLKSCDFVF